MSDVEVKRWENSFLEISLWMIRCGKEFYFFGGEVALALGYSNPKRTIQDHVDLRDKMSIEEILGSNYKMVLERCLKSSRNKTFPLDFFQRLQKTKTC